MYVFNVEEGRFLEIDFWFELFFVKISMKMLFIFVEEDVLRCFVFKYKVLFDILF